MGLRTLAGLLLACTVGQAYGQTTYTWNNAGNSWGTAANWSPGGVPVAGDTVQFTPSGFLPFSTGTSTPATINQPVLSNGQAALALIFGPTPRLGGWQLTGGGNTLTLGGGTGGGLTVRGNTRVTDTTFAGVGATSPNAFSLGVSSGAELVFDGSTQATTNVLAPASAALVGTLTFDNTTTNVPTRLPTASGFNFASGTLNVLGNASSTTYTLGSITGTNTAGVNTIRATPAGGGTTTLQFANVPTGTNTAFSTRLSTFNVLRFEAGGGATLGGTAVITFAGTPGLGANGLLANSTTPTSTSGTFGYAIASDAGGTDFATWAAATGVVRAGATATSSTLSGLGTLSISSRAQYNPSTSETTGTTTVGSLRITPAAAGLTLDFGSGNLATNALMLDGTLDYTISGSGLFGATGTRYIHVNNPATALTTGLSVVNGTNPSSFVGPGFLILNGASVQAAGQTGTSSNRFDLLGGTVRGNNTNLGFQVAAAGNDAFAVFNFRGGVLEIAGGANGTGTSADFTRTLGTADGQVRWEGGGGGFSAFGLPASVNLGGSASPAGVQWGATNFVADGNPLRFGSTRSNAVVTLLNPLQLDNGTTYQLREVNVVGGVGSDRTVFAGAVTGASNADLLKTGTGTLALTAPTNGYAGNTFVQNGTLIAGSAGTGRVTVGSGASLYPGTLTTGLEARPAPAVLGVNSRFDFLSGSTLRVRVTGSVATAGASTGGSGASGTANSQLSAAAGITLGGGANLVVDLTGINYTSGFNQPYSFSIGTTSSGSNVLGTLGSITFFDTGSDVTSSISGASVTLSGSQVYLNFTPVPEPATVFGVAAVALAGLRAARRRVVG